MNQALTHPRGEKLLAIWNDAYQLSLKESRVKTLAVLGGNQSGKSFTASKIFSKLVSALPDGDHVIWCISPNKEKSIGTQQRYVWGDFPRGMVGEYVWTEKNGFGSVNPMIVANMAGKKVVIKFKSVSQYYDDPDAFESETLSGMWIDEAVPHEVWEALQTRVAVRNGFILMSTIPSAEWMWETIENAKDETGVRMHKLLPKDNPAMTDLALERMYASITDPMERAMRLEGKFAMLDGIVFPEFKTDKHVFSEMPKVKMSFYAGMDVGLDHPTTWICVGAGEDGRFYVMDEWSSRHQTPQEDALQLSHFLKKYNLAATTYIDPAAFALSKGQASCVAMQYIQAGIPVAPAGKFSEWNRVMRLKEMFRNDELLVHESCVNLIRELRVWKFKRNQRNQPLNGGAMEDKNNDFCFVAGTMVDTQRGPVPIEHIKPGDFVYDGNGLTEVLVGGTITGRKPTISICLSNGNTIECTPEHLLATSDGSWVEAQNSMGLALWTSPLTSTATESELKRLSDMGILGADILSQKECPIGCTSGEQQPTNMETNTHSGYTKKLGSLFMGQFRKAWTFITSMEMFLITGQKIWKPCQGLTTSPSIQATSGRPLLRHPNGTGVRKALHGTSSMVQHHGKTVWQKLVHAMSAAQNTIRETKRQQGFARLIAAARIVASLAWTMLKKSAHTANSHSFATNMIKRNVAPENADAVFVTKVGEPGKEKPVYCIGTKSGSFSVSGITVLNCDSLKYVISMSPVYLGDGRKQLEGFQI